MFSDRQLLLRGIFSALYVTSSGCISSNIDVPSSSFVSKTSSALQVRQRHIQGAVPEPFHNRRHGQAFIRKSVSIGFSESVKFWIHYARTLSDGLQLAEEVSLHTANGVRKDQVAWLRTFYNHPIPQLIHERCWNWQLAPFALPPLALEFGATVRLGAHPHHVYIIEQITILRIRHFLLTATCVQKVTHP
jgi:hypothetical protein